MPTWKERLRLWCQLGIPAERLSSERRFRLQILTIITVATIGLGIPFIAQYALLGVHHMSLAVVATMFFATINLLWVRRSLNPERAGVFSTLLLLTLLVVSNLSSGGFYDPNFAWLYIVPLYAALLSSHRAGWIFTIVILSFTIIFWVLSNAGIFVESSIAIEDHPIQSLANRLSSIAAIGIILGGIASRNAFANAMLATTNSELVDEMERRQQLYEVLLHKERLASMGTLAAGIGHEINTPLTYAGLNLELVRDELAKSDNPLQSRIEEAIGGINRVAEIARDLKTFARDDGDRAETVEVGTIVERAVTMTQHEIRKHGGLDVNLNAHPMAQANPGRLEQVIVNLLTNAVQAIEGVESPDAKITISLDLDAEGWTKIAVRDTGSGVPPDLVDSIFEPYISTKTGDGGTGMGLSISRNLVEAMLGTLTLAQSSSAGSEFVVRLPAHQEASGAATEGPTSTPDKVQVVKKQRRREILVVDDEPSITTLIQHWLSERHNCDATNDAMDGLTLCQNKDYDLVLCDLSMPGLSGKEFYNKLIEAQPAMADNVAFVSGGAFDADLRAFVSDEKFSVLAKPFTLDQLDEFVDGLLT